MSVKPENDGDGIDRDDDPTTMHENVRDSAEGVEEQPVPGGGDSGGKPATGLIGNGQAVDPRYVSQR